MKNTLPVLFVALVLMVSCKTQSGQTTKHKQRPESPVIKSLSKYAGFGSADTLLQVEEFDENGHKTKLTKYYEDGAGVEYTVKYTTNSDGKVTEAQTTYADGTIETETHKFDKKGKVIETAWKRNDGADGRHEYKYDDHDSIVQWDWYEKGRFVISRLYPYVYKDDQLLESFYKETNNGRDTTTVNHWVYTYDSIGRLVRKLSIENEIPVNYHEYLYDSMDNRIIELIYSPDSMKAGSLTLSHRQFNTYNEYGELISKSISKNGGDVEVTINRTYDDFGHLTETVYEYADGRKYIERYKYVFYENVKVRK